MKLRNLMGAVLALAFMACGAHAFAAGGDITEIWPVGETDLEHAVTPVSTASYPLKAGDRVRFVIRLGKRNPTDRPWRLAHIGTLHTEDYDAIVNPMRVGIYISGVPHYATFDGELPYDNYTDFYFTYTVQHGDFALPVVLAVGTSSPKPAVGDKLRETEYYFEPKGAAAWQFNNSALDNPGSGEKATMSFKQSVDIENPDYDLRGAGFYVKTIDFEGLADVEAGKPWRSVEAGTTKCDQTPRLAVDNYTALTNPVTLYVWSLDESVVRLTGAGVKPMQITYPDSSTKVERQVLTAKLNAGDSEFPFKLEAGGDAEGKTTQLVLCAFPDFTYAPATGLAYVDYTTATVAVTPKSDPYMTLTKTGDEDAKRIDLKATSDYYASTALQLQFSQPYTNGDVKVSLRQFFGETEATAEDDVVAGKYLSFHLDPDADPTSDPSLEYVTVPKGSTDPVRFYVFALGSSVKTRKSPYLTLKPDLYADQPEAVTNFFAAGRSHQRNLAVKLDDQAPVIVQPKADTAYTAGAGSKFTVGLQISDNWRDLQENWATNGYSVTVEGMGVSKFTTNAVHFADGELLTIEPTASEEGGEAVIRVTDPEGHQAETVTITVNVIPRPRAEVLFYTDSTRQTRHFGDFYEHDAATPYYLDISFNKGTAPANMYAFLVPQDANASNLVQCAAVSNGLYIAQGYTNSESAVAISFLDGFAAQNPMEARFKVVFKSTPTIDDPAAVDYTDGCGNPVVGVKAVNRPSTVTAVKLDTESVKDGGTFYNVPAMIQKKFRAKVADLSEIDLRSGEGYEGKEVWVRFEYTDDWNGWEQAPSKNLYATNGLNNYAEMDVAFTYEGTVQRVNVYALDKDSRASGVEMGELEWGDPLFTFYVSVAAPQRVIIHDKQKKAVTDEDELVYSEDQMQVLSASSGDFYISLSSQPGSGTPPISKANPIRVKVTLEQYGDGVLDIHTNYLYYTTPADMAMKPVRIDTATLNGGRESVWWMTAEVDMENPGATDADGHPWNEHFAAASCMVRVRNVDPVIDTATAKGTRTWSETGTNTVAVGEAITVNWKITDITNDFYEADWKDDRFQIEWSVDSGDAATYPNPQVITNDWPRKKGIGSKGQISGDYQFNIPDMSGYSTIKMTVTDGDGGFAEKEWIIYVSPSKRAKVNVFGPRATAESKYKAAKGVGQGLVAAKGTIALCEQFAQTWEYDETTADAEFFAFGYPATNTWAQFLIDYEIPTTTVTPDNTKDEGKIPGYLGYTTLHGVPLNRLGNKRIATDTTWYDWATHGGTDPDAGRYDSYFYRWVVTKETSADKGGDTEPAAPAPTLWPFDGTSKTFTLDAGNGENKSGPVTYGTVGIEAIFARELRERDNLGDINADGIPDKIVELYGLGAEAVGKMPEDDLASLSAFNDDEDFLPNTAGAAIYSSLIPGLPGSWGEGFEFTARMEVRGFHDGLNDGAKLAGLSQYRFDAGFYSDDVEVRKVSRDYSDVEMMAWAEHGYAKGWSPERPTDPTKADTDEDKFPDGYEYYFWYKAHVGYLENGVHRYLTGRAYDPKNPGEGKLIAAATIARLMDPRSDLEPVDFPEGYVDDSSDAKTRDTDNDGLPDALEFEIGTNPFDFDTDGDGLPDGFEIMLGGTDPLLAETTKGVSDAMRNFDGDAMAFTTPYLEQNDFVQPKPLTTDALFTFALVDPKGDTDGIQWYVGKSAPTNVVATDAANPGTSFTAGGVTYVTSGTVPVVTNVTSGLLALTNLVLAVDLDKATTWTTTNAAPEGVETAATLFALMPTRIPAGTVVSDITPDVPYATFSLGEDVEGVNAAWVYGRSVSGLTTGDAKANVGGFGMLAIGRYQDAKAEDATGAKVRLAALPAQDDGVAYLHHFVYQEFGFDPRTAWNANTPLAPRWGKTVGSGEASETVANNTSPDYGYAGVATRTREYTLYDEFLVLSFFLNNGKLSEADVTATQAVPWEKIWSKYTTNGQGPNEPNWEEDNDHYKGRTAETNSGTNGADTDMDGVPDGWELYVMAGPKVEDAVTKELRYNLVAPYDDGIYSSFSPFVKLADSVSATDYAEPADRDDLSELQEYAGTDSCAYYCEPWGGNEAAFSTTIVRPKEHAEWLNKFFPTDPWNEDTDGDGLKDNEFAGQGDFKSGNFHYGTPVDDGKMTAIPGGGLNPCTVDTDHDGLPDPWEAQFAGQTPYAGDDAQPMTGKDGTAGNPLQGLCDGMDGTVWDAYNSPRISNGGENYKVIYSVNGAGANQVVDRDYDKDGLENWQEYMTGAMRAWRYDDPLTGWSYIPDDLYWFLDPTTGEYVFSPDLVGLSELTGETVSSEAEFWYRTFFDSSSALYNPHFVTGTSPSSQYFSRVTNGWDPMFTEQGTYYMFYDRVGDAMIEDSWGFMAAPKKYICTSPIVADTDKDGMDDGYELFHGLNPILGASAVRTTSDGPCDIVYDAWYDKQLKDSPVSALDNPWLEKLPGNGTYDFTVHPWLNGIVDVDPDGDDIRNQDEAIMPMVAPSTVWYHTDPTPLWMTDSSYGDSLVNRFFRMPIALGKVPVPESIVYDGTEYSLVDRDGFTWGKTMAEPPQYIAPFVPDFWLLSSAGAANWMYSFEENEGYDSDHDSGSDTEELQGKFRSKTDPQDADSPRRRQAMHFGGPENPSALQSMPFVHEAYPRAAMGYPDDMSFLQYTVECWVRPESAADATVLERTSFTDPSHVADERYVRRNFAIMIRNGKWCTAFDSNGTLDGSVVEVVGKTDVKVGEWTAVAATYDANRLTLYVNGNEDGYVMSSLKPEYGSSAVVVYPAGSGSAKTGIVDTSSGDLETLRGTAHAYWFDRQYTLNAFLIGASFANAADGNHLDVTQGKGWGRYRSFFKGWVDEVRVWDGARSSGDIATDVSSRKRYTREDALENRSSFYNQWVAGKLRYKKDGDGRDLDVLPELRFHWTFDSIPGADNAAAVAQAPHGFLEGDKPVYSRPEDYMIPWWSGIVAAYGSVYEGERNWVPWIPNTVTHLPRFDMTTLDSSYWSENYAGDEAGTYKFARTAEPVSKWTQYVRNGTETSLDFQTTGRRFWLSYNTGTNGTSTLDRQFEFTGRHLNQTGDDLLPLGGAFVKYVDSMWDDQGASSVWEQTGNDADNDGLADWWQEYAEQNYREGVPAGEDITWNTMIWYEVGGVKVRMTAGEAYRRDLAKGAYVDANGEVQVGPTAYAQTAKSDGMIPNWWKELKKIDGEEPLSDLDNDGLNNYIEYVASELLPFRLNLDPRMAKSDTVTLDYFRRIGKLYLGEMLTDHDQMEDHWERSLGDESIASAALWDALKDGEEDGWTNFAENRYNGYSQSILAQYISHAMGDNEVLDAPIPTIRMKVRYNGDRPLATASSGGGNDKTEASDAAPALVVRAFAKSAETGDYVMNPDAVWTVTPGMPVDREVYLGGWEDRIVRGTLAPGYVDLGSVNLLFAQVPQNDLYSWTDESGTHLAGTYKEFKEALDKNPDIIQNIQNFEWLSLYAPANEYTSADRAVTVTRNEKGQENARFAVYGEQVGTINLTTGDFEFDLGAMNRLRVNYTYDGGKGPAAAWSYKEAIFKITYSAKVSSSQLKTVDVSLAKADKGFVRGGLNSFEAFYDLNGNGAWDPGEPFGVANDVDVGWAGRDVEIELADMSAVTPRVKLWGAGGGESGDAGGGNAGGQDSAVTASAADSDRGKRVGTDWTTMLPITLSVDATRIRTNAYDRLNRLSAAPAAKVNVKVVRYTVDGSTVRRTGAPDRVVLDKTFEQESRDFLHEGDFLEDGNLDIDWKNLYDEVISDGDVRGAGCEFTNLTYLIAFNWGPTAFRTDSDTNTVVSAFSTLVTRRFEMERTVPTPIQEKSTVTVFNKSRPTFTWKIEGEDKWASWFGTTYTAFKVRVKDLSGNLVYDSGVRRLPAKDSEGQYGWTAPLYVGEVVPETGVLFANLADYTWEVAVYNAKFSTDDLMTIQNHKLVLGNPFSSPRTFRMNVTDKDSSSCALAVRACYVGPATWLEGRIRVQAFESPDFTGDPVAAVTLGDVSGEALSPASKTANAVLAGLPSGKYFLRAYIDTNGNGVHDDWESWGYLNERDLASKPGIFNPVAAEATLKPDEANVRTVLIEDCDTDGDWFPDVWEAEQNGGVFDPEVVKPVTGDAELIGVNPELKSVLNASDYFPMLKTLGSTDGFALLTGIAPAKVRTTVAANGTSRFSVDNRVDSVAISKLEFDADGNVVIGLDAKTSAGAVDPAAAAIYDLDLSKTVTCRIYRKTDLASSGWGDPVAEEEVTVGAGPVTIEIAGEKTAQAYYRAEIIEK